MVGRILDLPGRIAISSRTFSISSGNQSGPDLSFLRSRDYIKYIKAAVWSRFQPFLRICPCLALTLISLFLSMALSPVPLFSSPDFPSLSRSFSPVSFPPSRPTLLRFSTSLKAPSSRNYESLYTTGSLDYFLLELSTGKGPTGRTVECKCKSKLEGCRATLG